MVTILTMRPIVSWSRQERCRARQVDEFVTLHRPVPGGAEQCRLAAGAQAVGALAAHAGNGRRSRDAARARKDVEESKLAIGGPAMTAGSAMS